MSIIVPLHKKLRSRQGLHYDAHQRNVGILLSHRNKGRSNTWVREQRYPVVKKYLCRYLLILYKVWLNEWLCNNTIKCPVDTSAYRYVWSSIVLMWFRLAPHSTYVASPCLSGDADADRCALDNALWSWWRIRYNGNIQSKVSHFEPTYSTRRGVCLLRNYKTLTMHINNIVYYRRIIICKYYLYLLLILLISNAGSVA